MVIDVFILVVSVEDLVVSTANKVVLGVDEELVETLDVADAAVDMTFDVLLIVDGLVEGMFVDIFVVELTFVVSGLEVVVIVVVVVVLLAVVTGLVVIVVDFDSVLSEEILESETEVVETEVVGTDDVEEEAEVDIEVVVEGGEVVDFFADVGLEDTDVETTTEVVDDLLTVVIAGVAATVVEDVEEVDDGVSLTAVVDLLVEVVNELVVFTVP